MRILFVENHTVFAQTVMTAVLHDHDVTFVPSISQARAILERSSFDALLVDYDLDDGKGDELVRDIVATTKPRPKIVGVSARPSGNDALLAAGADAVVSKLRFGDVAHFLRERGP